MYTRPNISASDLDYVALPEPGGPIIRILGGLLGAFCLNLSFSILANSA